VSTLSSDTDARAEAIMVEHLRRMTPGERLRRACELRAGAVALARAGLKSRHPSIGADELRLRLASLWLDPDTMRRVYGWDPRAAER
jgi:hypothetical protein